MLSIMQPLTDIVLGWSSSNYLIWEKESNKAPSRRFMWVKGKKLKNSKNLLMWHLTNSSLKLLLLILVSSKKFISRKNKYAKSENSSWRFRLRMELKLRHLKNKSRNWSTNQKKKPNLQKHKSSSKVIWKVALWQHLSFEDLSKAMA